MLERLNQYAEILKNAGFGVQVFQANDSFPLDMLHVGIPSGNEEVQIMSITFLPMQGIDINSIRLAQFHMVLNAEINPGNRSAVLEFIAKINLATILGFFVPGPESKVNYKHILSDTLDNPMSEAAFLEVFTMIVFTYRHFTEALVKLTKGELDLQQALNSVGVK